MPVRCLSDRMRLRRLFGLGKVRRQWRAQPSPVARDRFDKPDLAGRRAFLAEHIVLHTHIPKTGGSALSHGLAAIFGAVHSMDLRLKRRVDIEDMTEADLTDLHFLSGHFPFGMHARFDRTPLYFAAVREPVARAISAYRFLQTHPDHNDHKFVAGKDFETAWHALADNGGAGFFNAQARMLTGTRPGRNPDPDRLWKAVDEEYCLVIPQPEITHCVQRLRLAFGVPWTQISEMNVSRGHETEISPEMRAKILETNQIDAALYEHVQRGFENRRKNACDYIASRCLLPLKDRGERTGSEP